MTAHAPLAQVMVVHIGDFQFAATRRPERSHHLKDIGWIQVDTCHSQIAFRVFRLFLNIHDHAVFQLSHAIALRISHFFQHHLCVVGMLFGMAGKFRQGILEYVVTQNDQATGTLAEQFGQPQGLGNATRLILDPVGQPAAMVLARAEQFDKVAHMLGAAHQQNIADAGPDHFFQGVVDHGVRSHWQQMLVGDPGQFAQTGTLATSQNNAAQGRKDCAHGGYDNTLKPIGENSLKE